MKFIDVFCGMGAFHQALAKMGHECVFACDIDKGARKIYEANYGVAPHGDITKVDEKDIPQFDILCAGFPCQPFSICGDQKGLDDEAQGTLIHHILRIMKFHQPQYAVLENVKNLCVHDEGRTLLYILDLLDEAGYHVRWNVLNAIDFGVPQSRERVFFVCARKDVPFSFHFSSIEPTRPIPVIRNIIDGEDSTDLTESLKEKYEVCPVQRKPRANGTRPYMVSELYSKSTMKGGGQGQRIYSIDYPGITVCAGSGGVGGSTGLYNIDGVVRTLNAKETLRMFGFPDAFAYHCSDRRIISYMGNSICVPILSSIFAKLLSKE